MLEKTVIHIITGEHFTVLAIKKLIYVKTDSTKDSINPAQLRIL